jgi:hypothetical protein
LRSAFLRYGFDGFPPSLQAIFSEFDIALFSRLERGKESGGHQPTDNFMATPLGWITAVSLIMLLLSFIPKGSFELNLTPEQIMIRRKVCRALTVSNHVMTSMYSKLKTLLLLFLYTCRKISYSVNKRRQIVTRSL